LLTGAVLLAAPAPAQTTTEFQATVSRATAGNVEAQYELGNAYSSGGAGVAQDHAEALKWYRRAADKGFAPALFNLGVAYEQGLGVTADDMQAFRYYLRAAEQGFTRAQFSVGNMYVAGRGTKQDFFEANLWFRQAADSGLIEAQFNLGFAYEAGNGVQKDFTQAARWYKQAADRGYARAQYNLGLLHEDGRGVAKDPGAAFALYRAAAERGFAPAQVNYGMMLAEGRPGAAPDPVQGFLWLDRAAKTGVGGEARDALARSLTAEQIAAITRLQGGVPPVIPAGPGVAQGSSSLAGNSSATEPARQGGSGGGNVDGQLDGVMKEKAELEQWAHSLEKTLNEKTALVGTLESTVSSLTRERADLQAQLEDARGDSTNADALKSALVQANARLDELQRKFEGSHEPDSSRGSIVTDLKTQLTELNQALEKSEKAVAELTAANDALERDLTTARQGKTDADNLREELAKVRRDASDLVALREENDKLRRDLAAVAELRATKEQLTRDHERLSTFLVGNRRDLDQAQGRVAELEKQLSDALTVRTRGGDEGQKLQRELAEANQTAEKLNETVAELTAANEKLEQDLENAQKSVAAALAAQSQAVSAASPDAYRMELSTLNARIKELEAEVEVERTGAAREVASLVGQLQRTRETNRSLSDANRALLSAKENDSAAVRDETARIGERVRELTAANEELRRAAQKQVSDLRNLTAERDSLKSQLTDAHQVATVLPGLAEEKAALEERLETVGGQLIQLQRQHDDLQKTHAELSQQLTASREAADKARAELASERTQSADAEKAAEAHTASVAELTQANVRLEQEREDMRRLVESYRGDIARLTQSVRAAEQQKTDAERSGQQNIDALAAQMVQLRRDLEAARASQGRMNETFAAQERERTATIAQLRTENAALSTRLNQAQGTLDQIAAAARLGTPASTIASGGITPVRPTSPAGAEPRYHVVGEGDSLSRISMRYYGTANRWQEIYQANRDTLQGSSALRVGMQLRIP
jgi:TPR repeat protein/nucleoid-associated protein YgaU